MKKITLTFLFALLAVCQSWTQSYPYEGNEFYFYTTSGSCDAILVAVADHSDNMQIPEYVPIDYMEDYSLYNCHFYNVSRISSSFFHTNITSITIPSSVYMIGTLSFPPSLKSIIVDKSNYYYDSRDNCNAIIRTDNNTLIAGCQNTKIPNSVTSISDRAFVDCRTLESITIPNSITSIKSFAFSGCTGLTKVDITDLSAWCKISFEYAANPLHEAHHLYLNGSEVINLVIPEGITSIKKYAFIGGSNFESAVIANSVTDINESAFEGCSKLQSITFVGKSDLTQSVSGSQLTRIGKRAFYGCQELSDIEIPEGVTELGAEAFSACAALQTLELPASVQSIGDKCFAGASALQSITINSTSVPQISENTFMDVDRTISVIVPDANLQDYANDAYWGEFINLQSSGDATVLQGVVDSSVGIYSRGNEIVVENSTEEVVLYNEHGAEVGRDNSALQVRTFPVPSSGVYVVRVGNKAMSVLVK